VPKFVAVLGGEIHVIRHVAPCFAGDHARVRQLGEEWVLESSRFEPCTTPDEVFTVADWLLEEMHRVLGLYLHLYSSPLAATSILVFDDNGKLVRRLLRVSSEDIHVYSADVTELSAEADSASFGSAILAKTAADPALRGLLELVGPRPLSWSKIYDIIKFLGDADAIAKAGLAPKSETVRMRRTANYHRHLGDPQAFKLPKNPPTFVEASAFAKELLKKWLQSRI
jgi:hypothetical protein